jgi:hypothetical protein
LNCLFHNDVLYSHSLLETCRVQDLFTDMQKITGQGNDSPDITLEAKIEFLKRPESYPDRPHKVEALETHMSWVFLTENYAYKLKKPVRYEFLDFSTVDARHHDCNERHSDRRQDCEHPG